MNINRRSFLKASALGLAAVAATGVTPFTAVADESHKPNQTGKWTATTCQGCTASCPVKVYTQNKRILRITGNWNCTATGGKICPKPHLAIQQVYDPDRIKTPMKRTNPEKGRGVDPGFVPISWDEALDTIADKLMELKKNGETKKLAFQKGRSTGVGDVLYKKFNILFGTPNYFGHGDICAEAEKMANWATEGTFSYHNYDLTNTKCFLMWSTDPISSNRMSGWASSVWGKVMDGAKIYVIDPRLSATAAKADKWLPIIPGTDGALACAIAHVILTKGLWNKKFVGDFKQGPWNYELTDNYNNKANLFKAGETVDESKFEYNQGYGLVRWWNLALKDATPEWAADICGVEAKVITEVATQFGKYGDASCSWQSPGTNMQVRGVYGAMAANALNGLVGSIETKGGVFRSASASTGKLPDHNHFRDSNARKAAKMKAIDGRIRKDFLNYNGKAIHSNETSSRLADVILQKDGHYEDGSYEIKMLISYWCNYCFSSTGAQRFERAYAKVPFYVNITTMPSESAMFADILLPAKHYMFERWGFMKASQGLYSYISVQQPVITPLWDTKTDETEIAWELAVKLKDRGFSNIYNYYSKAFCDPETGNCPTNAAEFAEIAVKIMTAPAWNGKNAKQGTDLGSWRNFCSKGCFNSKKMGYKKHWGSLGQDTGKFEFFSESLKTLLEQVATQYKCDVNSVVESMGFEARDGLAFVPHYETPVRYGDEKTYPYIFEEHRARLNLEGRSANCVGYQEFKDTDPGDVAWDDVIKINPSDMEDLGLKTGDTVEVTSPQGSIIVHAKAWEGTRPGVVIKAYGQGHWAFGHVAAADFKNFKPRGGNNNDILPCDWERLSGSTARHGGLTRVSIKKVEA